MKINNINLMNNIKNHQIKHIVVTKKNFEKLRKLGFANDSMNDVITRMLEKNNNSESDESPNSRIRF
jgi:hypothetical protein